MIKGERIYLRPIIKEDIEYLNKWKNDEQVFKYLGGGFMPVSVDQHIKWMDSIMDTLGNDKRYIICDNDNRSLGMIGLYDINWIHRTAELGIYLGEKIERGKGYGKESCLLLEKFAKEYLNIRKIKINVVKNNDIALKMWLSIGFKEVGELKEERYINGKYQDLVIMEKFLN